MMFPALQLLCVCMLMKLCKCPCVLCINQNHALKLLSQTMNSQLSKTFLDIHRKPEISRSHIGNSFTIYFIVIKKKKFMRSKKKINQNLASYLPLFVTVITEKRYLIRHFVKMISCQQIHLFSICMQTASISLRKLTHGMG